jgi:hypothetical protein
MRNIKRIPAEKLPEFLDLREPLAIEKDGKIVGIYDPKERASSSKAPQPDLSAIQHSPESQAAFDHLNDFLQEIYEKTGWTEDEFADFMDPRFELPAEFRDEPPDREAGGS